METTDPRPRGDRLRSLAWAARATQVRLRFLVALVVGSLVVGRWDVLRTYWDRWTAPAARDPAMGPVSADTEYFCPMDPGVLSDWPGKCPICHMSTVRRPKGDMGPLPSGVVARIAFSPDRVLLAGLRTESIRHRPLAREVRVLGAVTAEAGRASVRAEVGAEEAAWLEPGQAAEVAPDPRDGSAPAAGRVRSIDPPAGETSRFIVEVAEPSTALGLARFASVAILSPMAGREPFRSMPRGEPPTRPGEPRSVHGCPDHPDILRAGPGRCPRDDRPLERIELAPNQRLSWWCPMHPKVTAPRAGEKCGECGGMTLVLRMVSYSPAGEVLAVPESAVIDTGTRTVVYIQRMPGLFDGVEVRLGPRCGSYYPVVEGLEAGQAVASSGAFLVDAETRLNPGLAAGYFGARRADLAGPGPPAHPDAADLAGLSPADRALVVAQATCPVTGKRLGSMGTPVRVEVKGRVVFLCCDGCSGPFRGSSEKYPARPRTAGDPAHHP